MAAITASSLLGYDATSLAHLYLGNFSRSSLQIPLKLCQVGWGASLHSYFQVSPEMFNLVQVQALAGPLKDIQRPKPLLRCLAWVLRVFVLLKGEPSPKSEVLSALEQVFIKDLSELCSVPILTSPPVPAAEKHHHSMMLPPPCFTFKIKSNPIVLVTCAKKYS